MNKSIRETHPAFALFWAASVGLPLDGQTLKQAIQSFTVDVAEHDLMVKRVTELKEEVERLKKELEHYSKGHPRTEDCPDQECSECAERDCPYGDALHYHHDSCPSCWSKEEELIKEGERRCLERLKEAVKNLERLKVGGNYIPEDSIITAHELLEELGLGEEEKQ